MFARPAYKDEGKEGAGDKNLPSTALASRFAGQRTAEDGDSAFSAARAGMYGRLTRTRVEWRPDKVCCMPCLPASFISNPPPSLRPWTSFPSLLSLLTRPSLCPPVGDRGYSSRWSAGGLTCLILSSVAHNLWEERRNRPPGLTSASNPVVCRQPTQLCFLAVLSFQPSS
eukprot:751940-Hanusia_phi.AAC.3